MSLNVMEREPREMARITPMDRRYFPRWKVNKYVEYIDQGRRKFLAFTRDLSMDGASIVVLGSCVTQNSMTLRIHLNDKESVEVHGRAVWKKIEQASALLGITFDRLSEKTKEQITYHAFELKNRPSFVSNTVSYRKAKANERL